MSKMLWGTFVVAMLLVSGCGGGSADSGSDVPDLANMSARYSKTTDMTWALVGIDEPTNFKYLQPRKGSPRPTLQFENGLAQVFTGCNKGVGGVSFKGRPTSAQLKFDVMKFTALACADRDSDPIDRTLRQVFQGHAQGNVNDATLKIQADAVRQGQPAELQFAPEGKLQAGS